MLREIETSIPPRIAEQSLQIPAGLTGAIEEAAREVGLLDSAHTEELGALSIMLLRTESVASSKIEQLEAPTVDFARALGGSRANASATAMAAAADALETLIADVTEHQAIRLEAVMRAHEALLRDDLQECRNSGRLRTVQNWIGGSDHSPRGADYIPPPPDHVPELIDDLIRFCERDDLPALAQAALAHAQFESIHPFTDGNGRIGRGLINAVLRRRGLTSGVVVPLASGLVAQRETYFEMLTAYRAGDIDPILTGLTAATTIAARESQETARNLRRIPGQWRDRLGRLRRGSAADQLLEHLPRNPVLRPDDAIGLIAAPTSSVYSAIQRLVDQDILRNLTARKRNQILGAPDILDELTDLDQRIERSVRGRVRP